MSSKPVAQRFYPALSEVISVDEIPDSLSFIRDSLQNILSKIHYKNLRYTRSYRGDAAFYSLDIVGRNLGLDLPGGLRFVLNPDADGDTTISSFPITVEYQWELLAFLRSFNQNGFDFSPQAFYELGLQIFRLTEEQVLAHTLNYFVEPTNGAVTKYEQVVNDLNAKYAAGLALPVGQAPTIDSTVALINQNTVLQEDVASLMFLTYVLDTDIDKTKKRLQQFFNVLVPQGIEEYIREIILPKARASLLLSAAIEFPRNILQPLDANKQPLDTPINGELPKTRFQFAEALLYVDSEAGIGYGLDMAGSLIPQYSQIGNTGLIISFNRAKLDLSRKTNIPEADAAGYSDDFIGLYIQEASIDFSRLGKGSGGQGLEISVRNLLVGTGGVSGTIGFEEPGQMLALKYGDFSVDLDKLSVTLQQNKVVDSAISGKLTIPGFRDGAEPAVIDVEAAFNPDGGFYVTALMQDAMPTITLPGVFNLKLSSLTLGSLNGHYFVSASGILDFIVTIPMLGKVLPKQVEFHNLLIWDTGAIEFDVDLSWGDYNKPIEGNDGFEEEYSIAGRDIGPLKLKTISFKVQPGNGGMTIYSTSSGSISIGPFTAVVERVGLKANFTFPPEGGDLGPAEAEVDFAPPTGVGIVIESEAVKGGGYLYLDPATGRYAGVADLGVGKVRVKALGILEPVPGGGPGYSLLFLVYGEFKPVPLGLGFSLSGVGGLLGAHRSAHLERLRDGVRTGALAQLLFPTDPVRQAPGLLAQAGAWFPAAEGRYVFGLMGKVGWGRPKELLTLDVGVAVELPAPVRVAVFGVLRCELPNKDKPLVKLQAAFLGSIDTGTGQISFDATIYDSRLLQFTLSGDIAFRLHPGPRPLFVLSAGGFHPLFQPPAGQGLGQLRRMAIALSNSGDLTLLLTSYLAVTSNTVQLGSRVDFRYRINSKWDIVAFLGFDALVQLSPVYFQVTVAGGAAVRRKGKDMLALYLTMGLSGPAPWHIHGKVKFRVVGIGFSVSVDKTIGRREPQALEPAVDAEDLLLTAFKEAGSWSFTPAGGEEEPVVLRERPEGGLQVSPAGVLEVRQNALPLDLPIERVGESRPSGGRGTRYRLVGLTLGRETPGVETPEEEQQKTVEFVAVRDHFAVGQYRDMTDSERLSAPSFEEFPSGARALGLEAAQGGAARVKAVGQRIQVLARRPAQPVQGLESMQGLQAVGLESTALDPATAQVQAGSGLTASEFSGLLSGSAVGRSSRSWERRSPSALQPAPVALRGARFAVVLRGDLQASPGAPDFEPLDFAAEDFFAEAPAPGEHTPRGVELLGSRAQAQARLQALEAAEPAYRGRLQVVAEHELATA